MVSNAAKAGLGQRVVCDQGVAIRRDDEVDALGHLMPTDRLGIVLDPHREPVLLGHCRQSVFGIAHHHRADGDRWRVDQFREHFRSKVLGPD